MGLVVAEVCSLSARSGSVALRGSVGAFVLEIV
jgi:hypothetical protein